MVGAPTTDLYSCKAAIKDFSTLLTKLLADYLSLSPGLVGLESDRLLLLGAESVSARLVNDDFDDWGRCGADFVLLRRIRSCEDILLRCVDSGLDVVLPRVRGCWSDETGDLSTAFWDGTGVGVVLCVTRGTWVGAGSEGTVAAPPLQFPMRRYEAWDKWSQGDKTGDPR